MIRLTGITARLDSAEGDWRRSAARILCVEAEDITSCRLLRRSVDARRKEDIHLVLTLEVSVRGDEAAAVRRCGSPRAQAVSAVQSPAVIRLARRPEHKPVVVGCGPAGLFAALTLAEAGACPLVLERGQDVDTRLRDVERFWRGGVLDPESNVQFGEGGAGAFSDGKLNTGIKDSRCASVLQTFAENGAPEAILYDAKPHIGTDRLLGVVKGIRARIVALGGTVRFGTKLDGIVAQGGSLRAVEAGGQTISTQSLLLCTGHSARDTVQMLQAAGVALSRKPFSIGARIEHPQAWLDRAQYGAAAGHPALGAADYKLSARLPCGRGIYTFCMCPGGVVVAAASEAQGVVTNGMSYHARDGHNANSALLVDIRPEDLPGEDPLEGLRFQRRWEGLAFEAGGGNYRAPAQRVGDFLRGMASSRLEEASATYQPGVTPADLRDCLPGYVCDAMAEGIRLFDRRLKGFAQPQALLTGVETRSSSPVRILRDESGQANIRGLYPVGEGAGYAGGILSAAVDGIRAAQRVLENLMQSEETI